MGHGWYDRPRRHPRGGIYKTAGTWETSQERSVGLGTELWESSEQRTEVKLKEIRSRGEGGGSV